MSLQRNVQQQNDFAFEQMLATAKHFREHGVPASIHTFLVEKGVDLSTSAIVWAQTESYMLGFEFGFAGLLVTRDSRFFKFELELDSTLTKVVFVHEFTDLSSGQNTSLHNKGVGKGSGALAIEVMEKLADT